MLISKLQRNFSIGECTDLVDDQPGCNLLWLCTVIGPLQWCTLAKGKWKTWYQKETTHNRRGRERWRGATTGGCCRGCQTCHKYWTIWVELNASWITCQARPPRGTWQCRIGRQVQLGGTSWTPVVGRDESEGDSQCEKSRTSAYLVTSKSIHKGPVDGWYKAIDNKCGEKDQPGTIVTG